MPFAQSFFAFTVVALLVVTTVMSTKETCISETKEADWTIRVSEINATDCKLVEGAELRVKNMIDDAKKSKLSEVVVEFTRSDIVSSLLVNANTEDTDGIDLTIPFVLTVTQSNITGSILIFGRYPHASRLTFTGNTIKTTRDWVIYTGVDGLSLNQSSTLALRDNTITQELGDAIGMSYIISLFDFVLQGDSSLVCTGNSINVKRNTTLYKMNVLWIAGGNATNSSIIVSDNTMMWYSKGAAEVNIMNTKIEKCIGSIISLTNNTITTGGKSSLKWFWMTTDKTNSFVDVAINACDNTLNGATLFNLGQRYLYPLDLTKFLVSDCPDNSDNDNNGGTGETNESFASGIATTSTVVAGMLMYLFVYFLL